MKTLGGVFVIHSKNNYTIFFKKKYLHCQNLKEICITYSRSLHQEHGANQNVLHKYKMY